MRIVVHKLHVVGSNPVCALHLLHVDESGTSLALDAPSVRAPVR